MSFKKLTQSEITELEVWADMHKEKTGLTDSEKNILGQIENNRKNNWEGMRLTAEDVAMQQARNQFEQLKNKQV